MTIREQIIEQLDKSYTPPAEGEFTHYELLKECLKTKEGSSGYMDLWFEGVIKSLFYQPNHYLLVLEKKEWHGLETEFFRLLSPFPMNFTREHGLYSSLILCHDFQYQKEQDWMEEDNFIILEENVSKLKHPGTDKRLCSYCTTTEKWRYPQRKNVIVLRLESIDWELYNSLDKLELWREIFFKFKPR